jgi:hypothetical protein
MECFQRYFLVVLYSAVLAYQYAQTLAMLRHATAMPGAGLFDQRGVVRAVLFNAGWLLAPD